MADNAVNEKILKILEPYFGIMMARASLKLSCKESNLDYEKLGPAQLGALADNIENKMRIFVGTDKAKQVAGQIRGLTA